MFTDGWRTKRIAVLGRERALGPQLRALLPAGCSASGRRVNHANIPRMDRSVCCNWCTAATARGSAETARPGAGTTPRPDDGEPARDDPGRARARGMRRVAGTDRADGPRVVASARSRGGARLWVRGIALCRAPLRGRCRLHVGVCVVRPSGKCHWRGCRCSNKEGTVGRHRACLCRNLHAIDAPTQRTG